MCIQDGASVGGAESGSQASSRVDVRLGIRQELRLRKNVWGDGKSGRTIRGVEKAGLICVTRETAFFLLPLRACTLSCIIEKDAGIATKGVLCRMFLRENVEEALEAYKGACKTARIGHKASSEETAAEEAREGYYQTDERNEKGLDSRKVGNRKRQLCRQRIGQEKVGEGNEKGLSCFSVCVPSAAEADAKGREENGGRIRAAVVCARV